MALYGSEEKSSGPFCVSKNHATADNTSHID